LDGNHKSVAATLTRRPLSALEMQVDEDIERGRQMVEAGELFNWTIPGQTLNESMGRLRDHLSEYLGFALWPHLRKGAIDRFSLTVKERVDLLAANGELPRYMIERYYDIK